MQVIRIRRVVARGVIAVGKYDRCLVVGGLAHYDYQASIVIEHRSTPLAYSRIQTKKDDLSIIFLGGA